ncbi:MAG: prolipoprotein diacylglyceryl transferase [Candidatus Omnitrophota bacterium]|nr:prolipoprotein diacylglyceryl transferase [Candidatus Omnitrophota bacterium]
MHPIICKIGPFTIYSYGLMLAVAFLACVFLMRREAKLNNLNADKISDMIFWVLVAGIIGGRIFYILLNLEYFLDNPIEIIMLQHGGLVWYGGLFFALIAATAYLKINHLPVLKILDLCAPYIALGQAIGRLGCFLNGCCYGKPVSWGVYSSLRGERLHPTQLYSFVNLLIIFLVLRFLQKKIKVGGALISLYFFLASLERFVVEFFRWDSPRILLNLTIFQIISLFIMTIAIYANLQLYSRQRK